MSYVMSPDDLLVDATEIVLDLTDQEFRRVFVLIEEQFQVGYSHGASVRSTHYWFISTLEQYHRENDDKLMVLHEILERVRSTGFSQEQLLLCCPHCLTNLTADISKFPTATDDNVRTWSKMHGMDYRRVRDNGKRFCPHCLFTEP